MRNFFILAFVAVVGFLSACKEKAVVTEHGHRVINHTKKGGPMAQPGETVKIQLYTYLGDTLMGSTRRDYGTPREFSIPPKDQMPPKVPAFIDALLLMSEGDSATAYMTLDSSMKAGLPPNLKKYDEVRFEIVLADIITTEEKDKAKQEAAERLSGVQTSVQATVKEYTEGKLADKLTTLASGLKIMVLDKGDGAPIKSGDKAETMYYGTLLDGTMFDNSFERGQSLDFTVGVGQMIPGYDEGVQQLNHKGRAYFFIPYPLAYGEEGRPPQIPAKSELVFYVEVK